MVLPAGSLVFCPRTNEPWVLCRTQSVRWGHRTKAQRSLRVWSARFPLNFFTLLDSPLHFDTIPELVQVGLVADHEGKVFGRTP